MAGSTYFMFDSQYIGASAAELAPLMDPLFASPYFINGTFGARCATAAIGCTA